MKNFIEEAPPKDLQALQEWFGKIIEAPLVEGRFIRSFTFQGNLIEEEAKEHIKPNQFLEPFQRIEIYNQQYWWRVLNVLKEEFSLVARLFGENLFYEELGVPYLFKYPSESYDINDIGDRFISWLETDYQEEDKFLLIHAASLDYAYQKAFTCKNVKKIDTTLPPEILLESFFTLHPSASLFEFPYDLVTFRDEMVKKEVNDWVDVEFPPLVKEVSRYILYRNHWGNVSLKRLEEAEYEALSFFKEKQKSISDLCEELENGGFTQGEKIEENLFKWVQNWVALSFLSMKEV